MPTSAPTDTGRMFHAGWIPSAGGKRTIDSRAPFLPHDGRGLPAPWVYDVSERALRQREMNFAAKRLADMSVTSELDWPDALARLRWRGVPATGGLEAMPGPAPRRTRLEAAMQSGAIAITVESEARTVDITWHDPDFGTDVVGQAAAPQGWGGIITGGGSLSARTGTPIPRAAASGRLWPLGDDVPPRPQPDAAIDAAVDQPGALVPDVIPV